MTRMGKKAKRKNQYPRKRVLNLSKKSGPKKEKIAFKNHENTAVKEPVFIPKVKSR